MRTPQGRPSWPFRTRCPGLSSGERGRVGRSLFQDSVVPTTAGVSSASGICAVVSKSQLLQTSTSMCLPGPGLFSLTQGEQRLLPGKQNPCQPTKDQTTCKRLGGILVKVQADLSPGWLSSRGPPPCAAATPSRTVCVARLGKRHRCVPRGMLI